MWVLTLKQPYAWMVIHGPKDIENRSWVNATLIDLITRQQPFAVHAGYSLTKAYYREAVKYAASQDREMVVPPMEELVRGALLGTVVPTRVYIPQEWSPDRRWHMRDQNGWQLADRTALPCPVPMGGKQGFWVVDDRILGRAA